MDAPQAHRKEIFQNLRDFGMFDPIRFADRDASDCRFAVASDVCLDDSGRFCGGQCEGIFDFSRYDEIFLLQGIALVGEYDDRRFGFCDVHEPGGEVVVGYHDEKDGAGGEILFPLFEYVGFRSDGECFLCLRQYGFDGVVSDSVVVEEKSGRLHGHPCPVNIKCSL